jgi:hypothetical protein
MTRAHPSPLLAIASVLACLAFAACDPVRITAPTGSCIDGTDRCKQFRHPTSGGGRPVDSVFVSGVVTLNGEPAGKFTGYRFEVELVCPCFGPFRRAGFAGAGGYSVGYPRGDPAWCDGTLIVRARLVKPAIGLPPDSVVVDRCANYSGIDFAFDARPSGGP